MFQSSPRSPKTARTAIVLAALVSLCCITTLVFRSTSKTAGPATLHAGEESSLKAAYGQLPLSFEANRGQTDASVKFLARGSGYSLFLRPGEAVLALRAASSNSAQIEDDPGASRRVPRQTSATAQQAVLRMKVLGANTDALVSGEGELAGKSNYFIGKDPQKWQRAISNFSGVKYEAIYPGIDLVYYGNQHQLEYDFVIQPGTDPKQIALGFEGADKINVDENGELILGIAGREIRQHKPYVYQDVNGTRQEIASHYSLAGTNQVRFDLGNYDDTKPLVIDPVLVYSTYFGGTGNENATSIAVNSAGEAFITGTAPSVGFPGTPLQGSTAAGGDAYVLKVNAAGTAIVYASYFGGDNSDNANAITVDQSGNAYVAGTTQSFNFPTAGTPYQSTKRGGSQMSKTADGGATYTTPGLAGLTTANISGVAVHPTDPNTAIISTFGGQGIYKTNDGGASWVSIRGTIPDTFNNAVAIDPTNPQNMYLAACQPGGVYRSTNGGNTWSATSVLGICMNTVITDPSGVVYAGGFDGQGLHKSTDGGQTWSTYPVGVDFESVASLALDPTNPATLYAGTDQGVFKSVDGGQNWSVTGLSTGGTFDDALAVDPINSQIVYTVNDNQLKVSTDGGATWNTVTNLGLSAGGFPTALMTVPTNPSTVYVGSTTNGPLKSTDNGATWSSANISTDDVSSMAFAPSNVSTIYFGLLSGSDAFITKLDASGSALVYSTYLGGGTASDRGDKDDTALAIAVDASGNAFVGGFADTRDFPTVNGLQPFNGQIEAFLAKLDSNGSTLTFSTTFGGPGFDLLRGIALGSGGSVFVAGRTDGGITTVNAAQNTHGGGQDAFLMRLNPSGNSYSVAYSTYLGGPGQDLANGVAVDANNSAYIVGQTNSGGLATAGAAQVTKGTAVDSYLARFDQNGVKSFFTYNGGGGPAAGQASLDAASSVAVDSAGNAYVAGYTRSSGFPVTNSLKAFNATTCGALPCLDAFVTKFNSSGSARVFSTLIGGDADDQVFGIALDANGAAYVTGTTFSTEIKAGAIQAANGGGSDAFITKLALNNDLSLTLTDSPDPVGVSGLLTYTITVTNGGEGALTGVAVSDNLPANTTFVSATPSQGSCSGTSSVSCSIGSLNVGQNATITLRVTATSAGVLSNTANATCAESETNTLNNSATQTTNVTAGATYTVNSTADTNDAACTALGTGNGCTLREAIAAANASPGPDTISFNIPTSDPGFVGSVFTIRPLSALPPLSDGGTTIDGATQTLFSGNTNAAGPEVVISGNLMGFSAPYGGGLNIPSSGNHIHSLVINGFNNTGISITGAGATGNLVTGCFLGTNASGNGAVPNSFDGMVITQGASYNVVGGISPSDRNLISGNARNGMTIQINTNFNTVLGNFIGTDVTGTLALGNGQEGVQIGGSVTANGNLIGGTTSGARNLISGNGSNGISVIDAASVGNQVQGNFIGTNATGNAAVPNGFSGVQLRGSMNNTVGGTASEAGNLISGNRFTGIDITSGASGNLVIGNYIGTDVTGMSALFSTAYGSFYGNGNGVGINGSSNNKIGGTTAAERNVISGNNCQGVPIFNMLLNNVLLPSTNNTIQGNYIGLNKNGAALVTDPNAGPAFGNKCSGIFLSGSTNNLIGGTAAGAGNVIGGSAHQGVVIASNNNVTGSGNTIQGNIIGSNAAMNSPLPNGIGVFLIDGASNNTIGGDDDDDGSLDGVVKAGNKIFASVGDGINLQSAFVNGANVISSGNTIQGNLIGGSALLKNGNNGVNLTGASNNLIGGLSAGAGNTIAFNNNNGIVINCPVLNGVPVCGVGNQILSNSIYSHNNNRGIRFNSNGANFGNNNQASPLLFSVGVSGGSANIAGKLTSTANSNYRIQVFSNDSCNPTGAGEGQRFIGSTTTVSDGSGVATFSVSAPVQIGEVITATATNTTTNNTSQFSPCVPAAAYQVSTLQFSLPSFAVSEGAGNALITVIRSGDNTGTSTVNYATTDGSALAGSDYTTASGTVSFAPGEIFKTFVVPILNDGVGEPVKALNLAISNPSNAILGTQVTATLSIVDNDPAPQPGNNGKIAFGRRINNGLSEIFVMDQDGSNAVNVTNNAADDQQPSWSPDGTKLAFMSDRTAGLYQVFTMNADGTNVLQLSDNSVNHYTPTWSPDGTKILFESEDTDLYVINADGTNLVRLTNTPDIEANTDWSPDGTKILYTKAPGGTNTYELYVINADGTNPVQLTNNTAYDDWGQWSPDGSKIVFQTNRGSLASEVYVMNSDASNQMNLSNTEASEGTPSWSSDGTKIVFSSNRDGNPEVYSMNSDGSGVVRLTTTPADSESFPRWQPVEQKQNQTITFNAIANKTYGNSPFTVSATASSNLPITFSVVSGPATVSGDTVTITGAGPVTIRASQAGDATYNSATADRSFTVSPALLSVVADSKTRVYGAPNPTLTVHYSGFVNGENPGVLGGSLSVNTTANQSSGVGSYNITPSGYTSNNYAIQYVDATLTIDQAATTTASGNYNLLVPGNVNLTAQVTPDAPSTQDLAGGTVTFVIRQGATTIGTVASGPVSNGQASANFNLSSGGAYTVYASYSGTANYFGSTGIASLTVGNANPIPSITSVTPDSAVKKPTETGQFTLLIDGNGFMSTLNGDPANSSVDWYDPTTGQHTALALTSTTGVQIQAVVPFTLIRDGKTVEVSVNNPGPGGGTSNVQPFFITDTNATVTSADTVIPDPTTGNASTTSVTPSGAVLSAEASSGGSAGTGTLTVAQYSADPIGTNSSPGSSAFSTAEGTGYFDVYVAPGSSFTSLTLEYSNTGGTALYWWDGSVWALVSNQTYNPATGTITITVTTNSSPSIAQLTGTVFGVASGPAISSIVVTPSATVSLGSGAITLNAQFSDPGGSGPYTAQANWGDAQTTNLNLSGTTLTGTHTYSAAGTYAITVKVSRGDKFGTSTFSPVVVFDTNAGFLTGGGWFNSPIGGLPSQPGFTGKVQFETNVNYEPGTLTPTGLTKVSLPSREFRSTSFSSLSITGSKVLVFGTGTINGAGIYNFLLSGIDAKLEGKKLSDKVRIKIWNPVGGAVIYDSQMEAPDSASATVVLGGGNITIHK